MKRLSILMLFMLTAVLISCGEEESKATINLTQEQQNLYDELESYSFTAEEGQELYIFGGLSFYDRDNSNKRIFLSGHDNSEVEGYIDCQDNYGFIYSHRFDSYEGKIYEGRENQLLETDFVDQSYTSEDLNIENTRLNFKDHVKRFGYIFPTYGNYSTSYDDSATIVTTTLGKILDNDNHFVYDVLRLTTDEVNSNLHTEVTMSFKLSTDGRFEFVLSALDFYDESRYDSYSELEYEITFLVRETMYNRFQENLPIFSFPNNYQDCDIAYQAGNRIHMTVNRNASTIVKLYLSAKTYSIHLVGNGVMYTGISLYDEEMNLVNKDNFYNIDDEGVYYLEIENTSNQETTGYLFINEGEDTEYSNNYGEPISTMYPDETREVTLINYVPEDGYIRLFGGIYFVFEIVYNDVSYYTVIDEDLYIPVQEGEQVTLTIISITESGTGFTNWRFVLEIPD